MPTYIAVTDENREWLEENVYWEQWQETRADGKLVALACESRMAADIADALAEAGYSTEEGDWQ